MIRPEISIVDGVLFFHFLYPLGAPQGIDLHIVFSRLHDFHAGSVR